MTTFFSKKNNANSKIATVGGIDNSTDPVTFAVTTGEGSKFPASNFVITIDNEILLCTSRTGDNLTCTRAAESTVIAAHSQNADVELRVTAAQLVEHETAINANKALFDNAVSPTVNSYGLMTNSVFRQALINPNCQVIQSSAVNLTTGKLFGGVDMFYAKGAGTAVSAGTISQSTAANCGNSGFALKLTGVTLTGTGLVYAYTFIESINAKLYKNKTGSFSVKVYHDVGAAVNYTIKINKANSADNFSAVTEIAAGSATSVPNTTATEIKLENVSLGDCSNGIEIEISAACGAITTKNFEFTDWQFNEGSIVLPFCCKKYQGELRDCQRYVQLVGGTGTLPMFMGMSWSTAGQLMLTVPLQTVMMKVPTFSAYLRVLRTTATGSGELDEIGSTAPNTITYAPGYGVVLVIWNGRDTSKLPAFCNFGVWCSPYLTALPILA